LVLFKYQKEIDHACFLLVICGQLSQPEHFVVMPVSTNRYDATKVMSELISGRLDLYSEEMIGLADYCQNIAKATIGKEMLSLLINSKDFTHRAAAAFYFGYILDPHNDLFLLYHDEHPLVSLAAKESFVRIAKNNYGQEVDFGPLSSDLNNKDKKETSSKLWKMFFSAKVNIKKEIKKK
jgi:hypothetical protein